MKNKMTTYVLIFFVLLVWGIIGYRLFDAMNNNDNVPFNPHIELKETYNDFTVKKDTGSLSLNYRDPFGMVTKDTIEKIPLRSVPRKVINAAIKPTVNWNMIKYSGYIRNPNSKKLIAIMNINGKTIMLSEGESAEQVQLLKNARDSVKVSYKNQTKFIDVNVAAL